MAGSSLAQTQEDGSTVVFTYDASRSAYISAEEGATNGTISLVDGVWHFADPATQTTEIYDAQGRLSSAADHSGNVATYIYTGDQLTSIKDASGETLTFSYQDALLTSITETLLDDTTQAPVTLSLVTYGYDQGRLSTVKEKAPAGSGLQDYATTYTYASDRPDDAQFNLVKTLTQSDGTQLTFSYQQNAAGNWYVHTITDGDNHTTFITQNSGTASYTATVTANDAAGLAADDAGAYYAVQAGDTWASIAQRLYGTDSAALALQTALGSPALHTGDKLRVPLSVDYSAQGNSTTIVDADNNATTYIYDASGRVCSIVQSVTGADGSSHTLRTGYQYNANGSLKSKTDADHRTTSYRYDASGNVAYAETAGGNVVHYRYNAAGQVVAQTQYPSLFAGDVPLDAGMGARTTRNVYDASGLLRFTVSASGDVVEYRYDTHGQRIAAIAYAGAAYDVSTLGEGDDIPLASLVDWQSALGASDLAKSTRTDYDYDKRGQLKTTTVYGTLDNKGAGMDGALTLYSYDAAGHLLGSTNAGGGASSYTYDQLGCITYSKDAGGLSSTIVYDDAHHQVVTTLSTGLVTTQRYDGEGRIVDTVRSDAQGKTLEGTYAYYDANGQLRASVDAMGAVTWFFYDEAGRKVGTVDATGAVTQYVYDAAGQSVQTIAYATTIDTTGWMTTDPATKAVVPNIAAHATLAQALPQQTALAQAANQIAYQAYDQDGHVAYTLSAQGLLVQYDYDGLGNLVSQTAYAGKASTPAAPTYAALHGLAQGLTTQYADQNRRTDYVYDADNRQIYVVGSNGAVTQTTYDDAGRVASRTAYVQPLPSTVSRDKPLSATQVAGGLALSQTGDASVDQTVRYFYDAAGRQVYALDGTGALTQTSYDADGNVSSKRTFANRIDKPATWSPATAVSTDPQDQVTYWLYDKDNRVQFEVNGVGSVTAMVYDANGRLAQRATFNKQVAVPLTAAPSAATLAALATPGGKDGKADQVEQFYYDVEGHQIYAVDGAGHVTQTAYDADGRAIQATAYSGVDALVDYSAAAQTTGTPTLPDGDDNSANGATDEDHPADQVSETVYDSAGRIAYTVDPSGKVTQLAYDAFGHIVATTVHATGIASPNQGTQYTKAALDTLFSHSNPADRISRAIYNAAGQLAYSVDPMGYVTDYAYDTFGNVTRTAVYAKATTGTPTLPSLDAAYGKTTAGDRVRYAFYDLAGRLAYSVDEQGAVTDQTFDALGQTLTQTRFAQASSLAWSSQTIALLLGTFKADMSADTVVQNHYDAAGNRSAHLDNAAQLTMQYTYDTSGRQTSATDATSQGVSRQLYDAAGQLLATIDADGGATSYQYDAFGNRKAVTVNERRDAQGAVLQKGDTTQYTYDGDGERVDVRDALSNDTKYAYNGLGEQIAATDALQNKSKTAYDLDGRIRQQTDALSDRASIGYDILGNVAAKTDADGNVSCYYYDADGRLTLSVDATGAATSYQYDAFGNVIAKTAYATPVIGATPGTQPTVIANAASDRTSYNVYDSEGRLAFAIDATGAIVENDYDTKGNLVTQIAYATQHAFTTAPSLSDVQGVVCSIASSALVLNAVSHAPQDRRTDYVYDADNRAVYTVDPAGFVTHAAYDENGRIKQTTLYALPLPAGVARTTPMTAGQIAAGLVDTVPAANQTTQYVYDGAGLLVREIDSQGNTTHYLYDAAGRRTMVIDGMGGVSETVYDHLGNVSAKRRYAMAVDLTKWDGSSALDVQPDGGDQCTYYFYDAANRLLGTLDNTSAVTLNTYDAAGRLVQAQEFNTQGRVPDNPSFSKVQYLAAGGDGVNILGAPHTQQYVYDKAGRTLFRVDVNQTADKQYVGNVTGYINDADGRVTQTIQYARPYTYAAAPVSDEGKYNPTRDSGNGGDGTYDPSAAHFVYAAPDLSSYGVAGGQDHAAATVYDAFGGVQYQIDATGAVIYRSYDADGHLLSSRAYAKLLGGASASALTPSLLADAAHDEQTRYSYDAFGELTSTRNDAAVAAQTNTADNLYDQDGNLVQTTDAVGDVTRYGYDASGHRVEKVDADGAITLNRYDDAGHVLGTVVINSPVLDSLPGTLLLTAQGVEYIDNTTRKTVLLAAGASLAAIAQASPDIAAAWQQRYGYVAGATGDALNALSADWQNAWNLSSNEAVAVSTLITANFYDAAGHLTKAVDSNGVASYYFYDAIGNKVGYINKLGVSTEYDYDAAGRVISELDNGAWFWGPRGELWGMSNAQAAADHVVPNSMADTPLLETDYTYDNFGNLIERDTDAGTVDEQTTRFSYDLLNQQISTSQPSFNAGNSGLNRSNNLGQLQHDWADFWNQSNIGRQLQLGWNGQIYGTFIQVDTNDAVFVATDGSSFTLHPSDSFTAAASSSPAFARALQAIWGYTVTPVGMPDQAPVPPSLDGDWQALWIWAHSNDRHVGDQQAMWGGTVRFVDTNTIAYSGDNQGWTYLHYDAQAQRASLLVADLTDYALRNNALLVNWQQQYGFLTTAWTSPPMGQALQADWNSLWAWNNAANPGDQKSLWNGLVSYEGKGLALYQGSSGQVYLRQDADPADLAAQNTSLAQAWAGYGYALPLSMLPNTSTDAASRVWTNLFVLLTPGPDTSIAWMGGRLYFDSNQTADFVGSGNTAKYPLNANMSLADVIQACPPIADYLSNTYGLTAAVLASGSLTADQQQAVAAFNGFWSKAWWQPQPGLQIGLYQASAAGGTGTLMGYLTLDAQGGGTYRSLDGSVTFACSPNTSPAYLIARLPWLMGPYLKNMGLALKQNEQAASSVPSALQQSWTAFWAGAAPGETLSFGYGSLVFGSNGTATYIDPLGKQYAVSKDMSPFALSAVSPYIAQYLQTQYGLVNDYNLSSNGGIAIARGNYAALLQSWNTLWSAAAPYAAIPYAGGTFLQTGTDSASFTTAAGVVVSLSRSMTPDAVALACSDIAASWQSSYGYQVFDDSKVNTSALSTSNGQADGQGNLVYSDHAGSQPAVNLVYVTASNGTGTAQANAYAAASNDWNALLSKLQTPLSTDVAFLGGLLGCDDGGNITFIAAGSGGKQGSIYHFARGATLGQACLASPEIAQHYAAAYGVYYATPMVDMATAYGLHATTAPDLGSQKVTPTTRTGYDAFGNAVAYLDVGGQWSYKTYDAQGRIVYSVDADGNVQKRDYDAFGNQILLTSYAVQIKLGGNLAGYSGDQIAQALVAARSQAVQAGGYVLNDRVIATAYTQENQARTITEGPAYQYSPAIVTGAAPAATVSGGTATGESIQAGSGAAQTVHLYDAAGRLVETQVAVDDHTTANTFYYYDSMGRKIGTIDPMRYLTFWRYDNQGNMTQEIQFALPVPAVLALDATPDSLGRAVGVTLSGYGNAPEGLGIQNLVQLYDQGAKLTPEQLAVVANPAKITQYSYDRLGNQVTATDVVYAGSLQTNALDALLVAVEGFYDPNVKAGSHPSLQADPAGTMPAGLGWSIQTTMTTLYDAAGNKVAITDERGNTSYFKYDALGRLCYSAAATGFDDNGDKQYTLTAIQYLDGNGNDDNAGNNASIGKTVVTTTYGQTLSAADAMKAIGYGSVTPPAKPIAAGQNDKVETDSYDTAGHLVKKVVTGSSVQAALQGVAGGRTEEDIGYDVYGRKVSDWQANSDINGQANNALTFYSYDAIGQQTDTRVLQNQTSALASTGGTASPAAQFNDTHADYNAFGEVSASSLNGVQTATYLYDAEGRVWLNQQNGVWTAQFFNQAGWLTAKLVSTDGNVGELTPEGLAQHYLISQTAQGTVQNLTPNATVRASYIDYNLDGQATVQIAPSFTDPLQGLGQIGAGTAIADPATNGAGLLIDTNVPSFGGYLDFSRTPINQEGSPLFDCT